MGNITRSCYECNNPLTDLGNDEWRCETCGTTYESFAAMHERTNRRIAELIPVTSAVSAQMEWAKHFLTPLVRVDTQTHSDVAPTLSPSPLPQERCTNKAPKKRGRRPDEDVKARSEKIRTVAATGKTGMEYARALQAVGLKTPEQWQDKGCPETYPRAYKLPRWRTRINHEKSDAVRKNPPKSA